MDGYVDGDIAEMTDGTILRRTDGVWPCSVHIDNPHDDRYIRNPLLNVMVTRRGVRVPRPIFLKPTTERSAS